MKISFNAKRGRPRKDLNDEEKKWLETFFSRSDISYTNPERKDHVYVAKIVGKRRYKHGVIILKFSIITPCYKQRLYLLWNSRDPLDIINGTGKVDVTDTFYQNFKKLLTLSQLYDFVKYLN